MSAATAARARPDPDAETRYRGCSVADAHASTIASHGGGFAANCAKQTPCCGAAMRCHPRLRACGGLRSDAAQRQLPTLALRDAPAQYARDLDRTQARAILTAQSNR